MPQDFHPVSYLGGVGVARGGDGKGGWWWQQCTNAYRHSIYIHALYIAPTLFSHPHTLLPTHPHTGDGQAVWCNHVALKQVLEHTRGATHLVQVLHHISTTGFKVCNKGGLCVCLRGEHVWVGRWVGVFATCHPLSHSTPLSFPTYPITPPPSHFHPPSHFQPTLSLQA